MSIRRRLFSYRVNDWTVLKKEMDVAKQLQKISVNINIELLNKHTSYTVNMAAGEYNRNTTRVQNFTVLVYF